MTSSGTYAFNPALVDMLLDVFERVGIKASAITPDHLFSGKRSLNFVLSRWSNRVPNQWLQEEVSVQVNSGQNQILLPSGAVTILDVFERDYQLGASVNITPNIATTNGSAVVTVTWANHGLVAGQWVSVPIPVAIGGLIVYGFYTVVTVPSTNTFTITAASNATGTVSGGAVPSYATTSGSAVVVVTLAAHGYVAGGTWTVHQSLSVGGLTLLGDYVITATTTNTVTFSAPFNAGSTTSASENSGSMQIAKADSGVRPQDRVVSPLGRTEWAELPSKTTTSEFATSYFFDRKISPSLYIWPMPLLTSPKELHYWRVRQIQDGNPQNTETPDIPYRAEEALAAAWAAHLAIKWSPERLQVLKAEATETWAEFAQEDRERAPLKFQPQTGGYYP